MPIDPRKKALLFLNSSLMPSSVVLQLRIWRTWSETEKTVFSQRSRMIKDGFTMPCFICLVLLLNIDHEKEYPHLRKYITHLSDSCHFYSRKIAV